MKRLTAVVALALAGAAWAGGPEVYDAKCKLCHGKDLKGNPAMTKSFKLEPSALDLTDEATTKKSDAELLAIVRKGVGKMPAFDGKLSEDDLKAVVARMRETGGVQAAAPATAGVEDSAKAYGAKCASCHGKDGKGSAAMGKMFGADKLDLVDEASLGKTDEELAKVTTDGAGKMPAYKGKLTDAEIQSIVAYVRSMAPKVEEAAAKKEASEAKP